MEFTGKTVAMVPDGGGHRICIQCDDDVRIEISGNVDITDFNPDQAVTVALDLEAPSTEPTPEDPTAGTQGDPNSGRVSPGSGSAVNPEAGISGAESSEPTEASPDPESPDSAAPEAPPAAPEGRAKRAAIL